MITELTSAENLERIKRFVSVFLERCTDVSPVVPEAMRAGPSDSEGWTPWKAVDSTASEREVLQLEEAVGHQFPPLFRAYLLHRCLLMTEFFVVLPEIPSDAPLEKLKEYLSLWDTDSFFKNQSLLPFGYDPDGAGPICFDVSSENADGDYPIVRVDRGLTKADSYRGERIAESFSDLIDDIEAELLSYG